MKALHWNAMSGITSNFLWHFKVLSYLNRFGFFLPDEICSNDVANNSAAAVAVDDDDDEMKDK